MKASNILLIIGTTVGAGIFSLPIAFKQSGELPFFVLLLVLACVSWRVNIYFNDVVSHIKARHQLSGYVEIVLGKRLGNISMILHVCSTYGAIIAFAFIGGSFFSQLTGTTAEIGSMFFFAAATLILFFSGKKLENLDEMFAAIKGVLFIVLIGVAFFFFPYKTFTFPEIVGVDPYAAYGLILFSLTGFSIIPELHSDKHIHKSLLVAQVLIVILYLFFTIALSPYVIGEVFLFKNNVLTFFVNLTGFISVFTTYLLMSLISKDVFIRDLHFSEKTALGFTAIIPFVAIFFQIGSFMELLSLTGGVFLGGIGLLICFMSQTLHPHKYFFERLLIQLVFITGIILEIVSFVK